MHRVCAARGVVDGIYVGVYTVFVIVLSWFLVVSV